VSGRIGLVTRLWAGSGALAVVLFACGLLFGDLLGSSNYPPLNASYSRLRTYFLTNGSEVRALAFFHLLAALALACFAAFLHDWLRGTELPGPRPATVMVAPPGPATVAPPGRRVATVALVGGALAAAFLLLSALIYRALAEPEIVRDPALAHALVVISYLAGGPAISVPLTLPIGAGTAVALRGSQLPRWTAWLGVPAALTSLISAVTLLGPMNNTSATYSVLLLAAVLGLVWIFATSLLLVARSSHH
jgi:hypothetical protein